MNNMIIAWGGKGASMEKDSKFQYQIFRKFWNGLF